MPSLSPRGRTWSGMLLALAWLMGSPVQAEPEALEFGALVGPSWSTLNDQGFRSGVRGRLFLGPAWERATLRIGVANGPFGSSDQHLDYIAFPVEFTVDMGASSYFAMGMEFRSLQGSPPTIESGRVLIPALKETDLAVTAALGLRDKAEWPILLELRSNFGIRDIVPDANTTGGGQRVSSFGFELAVGWVGRVR